MVVALELGLLLVRGRGCGPSSSEERGVVVCTARLKSWAWRRSSGFISSVVGRGEGGEAVWLLGSLSWLLWLLEELEELEEEEELEEDELEEDEELEDVEGERLLRCRLDRRFWDRLDGCLLLFRDFCFRRFDSS